MSCPSNGSPLPIHRCAPTATTGRRRQRLVAFRFAKECFGNVLSRSESRPSVTYFRGAKGDTLLGDLGGPHFDLECFRHSAAASHHVFELVEV
jgi:hypothetical protein